MTTIPTSTTPVWGELIGKVIAKIAEKEVGRDDPKRITFRSLRILADVPPAENRTEWHGAHEKRLVRTEAKVS